MNPVFTAPEILSFVPQLDYSRLDYWARTGLLKPSIRDSSGAGSKRLYSLFDLIMLRVITPLRMRGVGRDRLHTIVNFMELRSDDILASEPSCFILDAEHEMRLTNDAGRDLALLADEYELFLVIPIGAIVNEVRSATKVTA